MAAEGQVEIIGWLYQYYNTEPKDETFALLKKNVKITKERIPFATQLFTPDWIVRYMVENSLGRLWVEGHPDEELKAGWKYYLEEAEQEPEVAAQLEVIRAEYRKISPEDIKVIDPCMGSGHILVYAFEVLMQIYGSAGYSQREAVKSILENNLYGLDIDDRAYQMAYFAVMMKARQYNRRILSEETKCHVYSIQESNYIDRNQLAYFGAGLNEVEKNNALNQMEGLLDAFKDAKEYGSILDVENYDWDLLRRFVEGTDVAGQLTLDAVGLEQTRERLQMLIDIGEVMARKYEVVVTNPPYMGGNGMNGKLSEYCKKHYSKSKTDLYSIFIEKCRDMLVANGLQAMITQQSWMFLGSFATFRDFVLKESFICNMVHLGARAFNEISGEVVQTTTFIMIKNHRFSRYLARYYRIIDEVGEANKERAFLNKEQEYNQNISELCKIPEKPLGYWFSNTIIGCFEGKKLFDFACKTRICNGE